MLLSYIVDTFLDALVTQKTATTKLEDINQLKRR